MEIKNEIEQEFDTVKGLVEDVLSKDKRARNSDLWLCLKIWEDKQQIKIMINPEDIPKMISPETIRRMRQVVQNTEGKYLPEDPRILIHRKVKEEKVREYFRGNTWIISEFEKIKYGIK